MSRKAFPAAVLVSISCSVAFRLAPLAFTARTIPARIHGITTGVECARGIGFRTSPQVAVRAAPERRRVPSLTSLNNYFFVARRLVAATLLARDPAAVVSLNRGSFHSAALSWTDGDTA